MIEVSVIKTVKIDQNKADPLSDLKINVKSRKIYQVLVVRVKSCRIWYRVRDGVREIVGWRTERTERSAIYKDSR